MVVYTRPPPYSYRDYDIGIYEAAYNGCKKRSPTERTTCEVTIRNGYKSLESGRLAEMMEAVSIFVGHLDEDERELFFKRNPDVCSMLNEYNDIEDLIVYTCPAKKIVNS